MWCFVVVVIATKDFMVHVPVFFSWSLILKYRNPFFEVCV